MPVYVFAQYIIDVVYCGVACDDVFPVDTGSWFRFGFFGVLCPDYSLANPGSDLLYLFESRVIRHVDLPVFCWCGV